MKNPIDFIKEVKIELKKVTWPTRQQTLKLTGVVIVVSVIVSIYLGALDYLFNQVVKLVLG